MSSNKNLKVRINITLPPDALEWLRARSEAQGSKRGMSHFITRLLMEDWARQEMRQETLGALVTSPITSSP